MQNNDKANKATTLSEYGITNAYTKTEVDNLVKVVNTTGMSGNFRYYSFKNTPYNTEFIFYTVQITGTYTAANTNQKFTATLPSEIKPKGVNGIWASVWMRGEPNCQVKYTSYTNSDGNIEVYVSSSGANKDTTVYVLIIGIA